MSTQTAQAQGKFVWHELNTKDPDAAVRFYTELFGWKIKTGDMGPMKYHEILVGDRAIGGIMGLQDPQQPPAWNGYVTVGSVETSAQQAVARGGKVLVPPHPIPGTGKFSILADPTGAVIASFVYEGAQPDKSDVYGKPGSFVWNELLTDDIAAAQRFYAEVFGWSTRPMDMGPMGTYHLFSIHGKDVGGLMQRPKEMPVSAWMYYVAVEDVDASLNRAESMGATVCNPPMDVPSVGRMATLLDPGGAMISLFKPQMP